MTIARTPSYSRLWSWLYMVLLAVIPYVRLKPVGTLWMFLWTRTSRMRRGTIKAEIHGESVLLNYGNSYPINCRMYRSYNNPLIEAAHQLYLHRGRPIQVVDVGAAIGDTVLLLNANCRGMISGYCCIDGDREFFEYLQHNTRHLSNCRLYHTFLSGADGVERSLVRTHSGTASAQGEELVSSIPLDALKDDIGSIDLLKIDLDGFDGKVLSGATQILTGSAPLVLFEWHPLLCRRTGNDLLQHFEVLTAHGYADFLWFTKEGKFSHFMHGFDRESVEFMAEICLGSDQDLHFDVIAVPDGEKVMLHGLAEMKFAASKVSRH